MVVVTVYLILMHFQNKFIITRLFCHSPVSLDITTNDETLTLQYYFTAFMAVTVQTAGNLECFNEDRMVPFYKTVSDLIFCDR